MKTIILLLSVCVLGACTVVDQRPPVRTTTTTTESTIRPVSAETQVIRSY